MKSLKNEIFLKNKKSYTTLEVVIAAAILIGLLFVFFYAIFPIITGKQVPFLQGQTEYTTTDCDNDGVVGLADACPCVKSIQTLEKGQLCPQPDSDATKNCPNLCKPVALNAKKS